MRRAVVAGPFLGEVGFELLYWIPFLRRALQQAQLTPEQVSVITRGGAGSWYGDLAARRLEADDLMGSDALARAIAQRLQAAGDAKMLTVEAVDRTLMRHSLVPDGGTVHPALMYATMRPFWEGRRSLGWARTRLDHAPLPRPPRPPTAPERYVLARLYASDALPPGSEYQAHVVAVLEDLARRIPVVALVGGSDAGAHPDWLIDWPAEVIAVHAPTLAAQSAYIAHAAAFICTYGGLAYGGPLLGTSTLGVYARSNFNVRHLALAQDVFGQQLSVRPVFDVTARSCGELMAMETTSTSSSG